MTAVEPVVWIGVIAERDEPKPVKPVVPKPVKPVVERAGVVPGIVLLGVGFVNALDATHSSPKRPNPWKFVSGACGEGTPLMKENTSIGVAPVGVTDDASTWSRPLPRISAVPIRTSVGDTKPVWNGRPGVSTSPLLPENRL